MFPCVLNHELQNLRLLFRPDLRVRSRGPLDRRALVLDVLVLLHHELGVEAISVQVGPSA